MGRRGRDRKKKRDKEQEKKCLDQIQGYLKENLVMASLITPLLSAKLISHDDSQRLDRETRWTTADQVDFLFKILSESKEPVLETFIQVLRENDHGHVLSKIQEVKASLSPSNRNRTDSSTEDEARTECKVIAIPRTVSRATVTKVIPDDAIMTEILDMWNHPLDESRFQKERLMALVREKRCGSAMILLHLQEALTNFVQDDLENAETKAKTCLETAKMVTDAGKRAYLVARCLCLLPAVNRNLKRFGNAQTYIDLARQELSTLNLQAAEFEAYAIYSDGRLAMDIFRASGSKEVQPALVRKAIKCFEQVLSSFQDSNAQSLWWPSIRQYCLLNLAQCYLRYPGGEKRCQDSVSDEDMLAAYRCISRLRRLDLMNSMDSMILCHLIRTEGDLLFREKEFQGAIEKLNESKCIAAKIGFHMDVRYCDERLRFVEAAAKKYLSPFRCEHGKQIEADYDADMSNVESSGEEFQSAETGAYNDEQICEAMSNTFLLCPEQEVGSPNNEPNRVTKSSNTIQL